MKLQTPVIFPKSRLSLDFNSKVVSLGSCFSDNIGSRLVEGGVMTHVNPFGTLYNPVSIRNSVRRLLGGNPFTGEDCIEMGAGAGKVCSYSHHTSFARDTEKEFLLNANSRLSEESLFFSEADTVIITLGTAWCFHRADNGEVVSNCLKRPAKEFERRLLSLEDTVACLKEIVGSCPGKKFFFTVSPIRHMSDGAHQNQISKSTLLLAVDSIVGSYPDRCEYFPAYEIMMDELRDYRFYADDMVHPSNMAVEYIWSRFSEFAFSEKDREVLSQNQKEYRQSLHRQILK